MKIHQLTGELKVSTPRWCCNKTSNPFTQFKGYKLLYLLRHIPDLSL